MSILQLLDDKAYSKRALCVCTLSQPIKSGAGFGGAGTGIDFGSMVGVTTGAAAGGATGVGIAGAMVRGSRAGNGGPAAMLTSATSISHMLADAQAARKYKVQGCVRRRGRCLVGCTFGGSASTGCGLQSISAGY